MFHFLAAIGDDLPSWVGIPTGIAGLGIPLGLWLTGRIVLRTDCETRVHDAAQNVIIEREQLKTRIESLIAERNSWHEAHSEEVKARITAEQQAAKLLDQANVSNKLLDALVQTLSRESKS